jgi:hypothetical protein
VTPGSIAATDPACFPNWDLAGRCQQYEVIAAADGTLTATLRLSGPPRGFYTPDLFLLAPDNTWAWAPEGFPERSVSMTVRAGESYCLVVVGYGPFPESFEAIADVQPQRNLPS